MQKMTMRQARQALCRATGRWGLYVSGLCSEMGGEEPVPDWLERLKKSCPFLDPDPTSEGSDWQAIYDGEIFVLCDSREECDKLFYSLISDDDPSPDGPSLYGLTITPEGEFCNENT
jgi:hypothetical protein